MTADVALAAAATGLAVLLVLAPRPGAPAGRPSLSSLATSGAVGAESPLRRHRATLSGLAALGAFLFVGGAVGAIAGALAGVVSWRVLGRVESPGRVRRRARIEHDLPGAVDLLVAALGSGSAPGAALGLVGSAIGGPVGEEFAALRRRLELGTDPVDVWRDLLRHPQLGPLGRALGRAHETGASVTVAGERLAAELRELSRTEVETRARNVSTRAAAPLGACFLPAFVLLGVVPLVVGLVGSMGLFS